MIYEEDFIKNVIFTFAAIFVVSLMQGSAEADVIGSENLSRHRVMTFYYTWYGIPEGKGGNGTTRHWGRIDANKNDIEAARDYPLLMAYDSHEPKVVEQHCQWASESGIDAFIVSWWGQDTYEDASMPLILDACRKFGMNACIYYEVVPSPKSPQDAADDILQILNKYAAHPAYLKINGKPVIFVYNRALDDIGLYGWYQVRQILNEKYKNGTVLIGDQMSYGSACVFDGIHTYNTCGYFRGKSVEQISAWCETQYTQWVSIARQNNRISTLTVMPGYDDTKFREPGFKIERVDGRAYQVQWQNAITASPDWILVTSFNEWHEGSEIEPSAEHKDHYLKLTQQYAKEFKVQKAIAKSAEPSLTETEYAALQEKLQGKTIAVLPEPESAAFWFLLGCNIKTEVLKWDDVAKRLNPKTYPFLLYAGNETYLSSVRRPGDVDAAIVAYIRNGGVLLVLPSGPMPFYYDQKNKRVVDRASKFGLLLNQNWWWERPPKGKILTYVQKNNKLPHLPTAFAFPTDGDLRWRPFISDNNIKSQTLIELKDSEGKTYGDALVIVYPHTGGLIVYGWFGLVREHPKQIVYDLLMCID